MNFDVLIPAHGETINQIENLIHCILLQKTRNYKLGKILLCSDNPALKFFGDLSTVNFIEQPRKLGKADALIRLLKSSDAPNLAIQNSADCLPASENTYYHLLKHFERLSVGAVTSRPEPFNRGFMYLPNIVWKAHNFVQPKLSAELFAFRKILIQNFFKTIIHDDAYIHHVIESMGYQVVYEPKAVVFNRVPETFGEFYHQRKKNVVGNMQLGDRFKIAPPKCLRLRTLVLMSLELLANAHGRLDYVRGKIPEGLIGYNLESTKEVIK